MKQDNVLIRLIGATILLLCMMGCVDEEIIGGAPAPEDKVVVKMTIPSMEIPTLTRSDEDKIWEREVKVIDLLIFDNSTPAELLERITIRNFTQKMSERDHLVEFQVTLLKDKNFSNARTIVLVANAHKEVEYAMVTGAQNKPSLLERLIFQTNKDQQNGYKWNSSSTSSFTPLSVSACR